MNDIKRFFKKLSRLIIFFTIVLIGIILWSYITGTHLKFPAFTSSVSENSTQDNFLLDAVINTEELYISGSNEVQGLRGYINVSSSELSSMTPSQYYDFYETVLKNSSYQWFSIVCPDGTGLFIPDCADGAACFCTLDSLGRQTDIYGYLIIQNGTCVYQEAE